MLNSTGPELFTTQLFSKSYSSNSFNKLIAIKNLKRSKKIKSTFHPVHSLIYTKSTGKIKTKLTEFNIFSTLNSNIFYKVLNNTTYKLKGNKQINLYNTNKGYCLSYMPIYKSIISQLKHKLWNNTEEYLKSFHSGEILFKNALQLLVKNKNNNWVLYSLKNILAFQNYFLQKTITKSGIHCKNINNKQNILKLFHIYPITYPFKEINNINRDLYKKKYIIYNIPVSSNKIKLYSKILPKNIYRYLLININGESLHLNSITDKYYLTIAN
nr:RNA polymerase subunit beta' [Coccidia sp. AB-2023a]